MVRRGHELKEIDIFGNTLIHFRETDERIDITFMSVVNIEPKLRDS